MSEVGKQARFSVESKSGRPQPPQASTDDLLTRERNLTEFIWGLISMLKSIPEHERGGAKIKAELVYEKQGEKPKLTFKVTF